MPVQQNNGLGLVRTREDPVCVRRFLIDLAAMSVGQIRVCTRAAFKGMFRERSPQQAGKKILEQPGQQLPAEDAETLAHVAKLAEDAPRNKGPVPVRHDATARDLRDPPLAVATRQRCGECVRILDRTSN